MPKLSRKLYFYAFLQSDIFVIILPLIRFFKEMEKENKVKRNQTFTNKKLQKTKNIKMIKINRINYIKI